MLSFIGSVLFFVSLSSGADSAFVDRVENEGNVTAYVEVNGEIAEFPTVSGKGGLREGQRIGCETHKRLDGTSAVVCSGHVVAYIDIDGSRRANPYFRGTTYTPKVTTSPMTPTVGLLNGAPQGCVSRDGTSR